jgi:hypothetical protein
METRGLALKALTRGCITSVDFPCPTFLITSAGDSQAIFVKGEYAWSQHFSAFSTALSVIVGT